MANSDKWRRALRRTVAALGGASVLMSGMGTATAAEPDTGAARADGGAPYCVLQPDGGERCYADEGAAFRAAAELGTGRTGTGVLNKGDCPDKYLCLWDDANFVTSKGMRKYVTAGTHFLSSDNADDWANSVFNNRKDPVGLVDSDCHIGGADYITYILPGGHSVDQLSNTNHPCGGSWNNKIDAVVL
ncbi:peptidase inhibitor family I36 protein [Streptomyces sp. NPDC048845]|uniref:peptidase inhibitor family I36 protein n=1 Tax=Streptomyces sp. NPDC048845 TaxID=3155390 RepID=UPI00341338FE